MSEIPNKYIKVNIPADGAGTISPGTERACGWRSMRPPDWLMTGCNRVWV